jgi:ketosteroid isomerase-like protein
MNTESQIIEIVQRFNDALNQADVDAMTALLSEDTVFENTDPAPDGARYVGKYDVNAFWREFFQGSASARIEVEEIFAVQDRCTMRWTYYWRDPQGNEGHIRGVDVYRLRDGLITEKFSYVKG